MTPGDFVAVLLKSTVLFVGGILFLSRSRRARPVVRHLVCLALVVGSLASAAAMLLPEPAFIVRGDSFARVADAAAGISASLRTRRWAEFAEAIWLSGCALVMLRFLSGCFVLYRLRRGASAFEGGAFTAAVPVPILTGLFRPMILLPRSAADWPAQQREAAILHEIAHLNRGDLWANFAVTLACAVYWFHPAIWPLARRMRLDQEAACDDAVLDSGFDLAVYAEALIATARGAIEVPLAGVENSRCPMADSAGLKLRLARLLFRSDAPPRPMGPQARAAFAALLAGLVGLSLAGQERVYIPGGSVDQPALLESVEPRYTAEAIKAGIQGRVILSMTVCSDGLARDIVVEQGIGHGLDANAVRAIEQWRFHPAQRDGAPVAVRARVAVNFRLREVLPSRYTFLRLQLRQRA